MLLHLTIDYIYNKHQTYSFVNYMNDEDLKPHVHTRLSETILKKKIGVKRYFSCSQHARTQNHYTCGFANPLRWVSVKIKFSTCGNLEPPVQLCWAFKNRKKRFVKSHMADRI